MTVDYAAQRRRAKEALAKSVNMPGIRPRIKRYMQLHLVDFIDDVFNELEAGVPLYDLMSDAEQVFVKVFSFMVSMSNDKVEACAFYIRRLGREFQTYMEFLRELEQKREAEAEAADSTKH